MKKFVFKLQTALDLKLKAEEMKKEELVTATDIYKESCRVLEYLKTRLAEIQDTVRGKQGEQFDVTEIRRCQDYIPVINEHISQQALITEEHRVAMEEVRGELVEIMKERKILEKLRTRHYQDYMREFLREEQKQIDEMATTGFIHRDSAV
ncbi:flagellar export protein FliJ [Phosphitispora fastidiosa]|uniref:flagellar export protein FliJ n=1 Tax=Phosphitispora fastidiosa TaxID=2837202 RepID=UPI001E33FBFF|nr:flagellar export protein FliJ [Phosphitispora fastidiosa]MBU7008268.1 flagellar FliJ protein [Phosphitispora fastidiosa]